VPYSLILKLEAKYVSLKRLTLSELYGFKPECSIPRESWRFIYSITITVQGFMPRFFSCNVVFLITVCNLFKLKPISVKLWHNML
jgi:hypothetical protein